MISIILDVLGVKKRQNAIESAAYGRGGEKVFVRSCYLIVFAVLCMLFFENFIFSESFSVLRFREIDDVAFQETLRRVHLLIESGQYSKLWEINDYAYGWIFWFVLSLLTYPLYLLNVHFGVDWPLIVVPRQISLLLSALTLLFLNKILHVYGVGARSRALAVLLFTLFPTFGFFSQKFGTVSAVMFFSVLSLYFAFRDTPSTRKGRLLIILSLAVAGGIKLSGLLVAPLIFLLILFRYERESLAAVTKDLLMSALLFLLTLVVFTNPALLTAYFYPEVLKNYWQILDHFMSVTHVATDNGSAIFRFYRAVFSTEVSCFVMLTLFVGVLISFAKDKKSRPDLAAVIFVILLASAYLVATVKNGNSIGVYFTSISFLLLFGVAGLARSRMGFLVLLLLPVLLFADLAARAKYELVTVLDATDVNGSKWNPVTYFIKEQRSREKVEVSKEIEQCMGLSGNKEWNGHVFIDYTIPTGFNSLSFPRSCVSIAWGNLSPAGKYCDRPLDFLVLDKKAKGWLPDPEFNKKLAVLDPTLVDGVKTDRLMRFQLLERNTFNNQQFKRICDLPSVDVFEVVK